MTLARIGNFGGFLAVVGAMLVVELVLWNGGHIEQPMRNRLHFIGFGFVGAMIAAEMVFEYVGELGAGARRLSRGFPVLRRKD